MKQLAWLAISSWVFFFSFAEAAPDLRGKISQEAFDSFLQRSVDLFLSGNEHFYKGRMKVGNLKSGKTEWDGAVTAMTAGRYIVVETPAGASKRMHLMVAELFKPDWKSTLDETLFRFQIPGSFGNHGRAEVGDVSAFKEIDVAVDEKTGVMTLRKVVTARPLSTDFGSYDDHSFEGTLAIVEPADITLHDVVNAPTSTFAGAPTNELAKQYREGKLKFVGGQAELVTTLTVRVPRAEALKIDPTLPPCVSGCGDEVPYTFEYQGEATLSEDLKVIRSKTSQFGDLKCSSRRKPTSAAPGLGNR